MHYFLRLLKKDKKDEEINISEILSEHKHEFSSH